LRFDNLAETLLKGGIAPRHVRRYLAELREHLEDLTAEQHAAGYDGEDAVCRARARLGSDDELAAAMLEQKQFRSLAARASWAVFLLLPPVTAIAIGMVFIGSLVLVGKYYGFMERGMALAPHWFQLLATGVVTTANLVIMPLAAAMFVTVAARQHLKLIWPCLATALLLALFIHGEVSFFPRPTSHLSITAAPIFMAESWRITAEHWPLVTAQYLLTLVPFFWLAWRRRTQA
jgi:hypothetical protein